MVYKVSDVVKELGVSRQTVYKKLRRDKFKKYIVELNGVTAVTEEGLQELKAMQSKDIEEVEEKDSEVSDVVNSNLNRLQGELIQGLQNQIEVYKEQLKVKDKQLEEKDRQITELIKVTENGQFLQKMILNNTEIKLLAYKEELEVRRNIVKAKEKKGLISKIKSCFN